MSLFKVCPAIAAAALPLALSTSVTTPVAAQSDAGSRALAVQLFDEAEALFAKSRATEACPKYAESYRLDPQLGVLIYLAECYEKNGQLASAWGSYREAEEIARKRGDNRAEHARERAAALEGRLSYLVIRVPDGARVPGLQVLRDGVVVAPVLWGQRAAIDAGSHRLEAQAPGYRPWRHEVITSEQNEATTDVPKLVAEPGAPTARRSDEAGHLAQSPVATQRIAAIAVGGLGIVGVGVGGFFGLSAQASQSDAKDSCNEHGYCTPRGDELTTSAKSKALVATVATGAGAAALVTAAVLWFTAPRAEMAATPTRKPRTAWAVAPAASAWGLEVTRAF